MTEPSPKLRGLFSALVVAQGLALVAARLTVSSVNLPGAPQRIGHEVVLTLGLVVAALGLLSLRLPVKMSMALGSSLLAVMAVFGAGYRPLQRGDLVLTLQDESVSYPARRASHQGLARGRRARDCVGADDDRLDGPPSLGLARVLA